MREKLYVCEKSKKCNRRCIYKYPFIYSHISTYIFVEGAFYCARNEEYYNFVECKKTGKKT